VLQLSEEQVMAKCVAQAQTLATADIKVMDPETMLEVPADGITMGEVMIKGNNVMKGYFKNPVGTAEAFNQGWFHSGDLGVMHANGRFEIKDRSKGENIRRHFFPFCTFLTAFLTAFLTVVFFFMFYYVYNRHYYIWRGEYCLCGGGEHPSLPSGSDGGGRGGHAAREVGRSALCLCGAQPGCTTPGY
jgi:hypothetical protein